MSKQRKPHTPEQTVRKLGQTDRLVDEGETVADVCRECEVAEQTYYRWRNQYGGMKTDEAKRLKELEKQNSTLKRLLTEAELEKRRHESWQRETLSSKQTSRCDCPPASISERMACRLAGLSRSAWSRPLN